MSMDRAAEHSHADLLKSAAPSVGVTFLALAVLAAVAGDELPVGPTYVLKALAAFGAAAALTLAYLPRHRPFDRFGPANAVTLCRAGFVALLAGLIGEGAAPSIATVAVVLGTFAAVLDGVDGPIARKTGLASEFGARFDMETDTVLVLVLAVLAWQFGKAGPWVLALGLARYAFVAAGRTVAWLRRPLPPSVRRKTVCAVQMAALIVILAPVIGAIPATVIAALALALLCYSFAIDVRWLRRQSHGDAL